MEYLEQTPIPMTGEESTILYLLAQHPDMPEDVAAGYLLRLSVAVRGVGRALRGDLDVSNQEYEAARGIQLWAAENARGFPPP
jgi:hypothetical protein